MGRPRRAAIDAMFTIRPPPRSIMFGITACMPSQTPLRSVPMTCSQASSVRPTTLSSLIMFTTPATLASRSIRPCRPMTSCTVSAQLLFSRTSR